MKLSKNEDGAQAKRYKKTSHRYKNSIKKAPSFGCK